ncbi:MULTISPECIES: biopolymer transporter ExbD [unclassified Nitratiruptor]|uniref:ExbD/TolR family protein n=1 Tax=unclassified Nitratiruptor TaxID=2624044 RepID=UPI0019169BB5|nr:MULTISPECIES: biopolymer transporter ExbD [unclassified Nitratiruptor]BCD61641.1 biopolymer transport protein ExbD [Nitratiruptor sp. YY08-13]BCD65576.1 biopolymer transport protein ExbD [Nitratiruptor sp. YY08-26]BCD68713.1 biopolymer transport protein ExbD [Nitratiruptor sp. YY09-18]
MKRREQITPDMTPLIDVVFLLLVFFLVSTVFKKDELALLLNLPSSKSSAKTIEKEKITIELSSTELALGGKKVSFKELDGSLARVADKKQPVFVRIDKDVRYERIVKLLDILKKYELNNIALVNEAK